ncbi:MAG: hypothetical protein IJY82_01425 [Oscillospiraceae bacterium]|nr:hypothetical protein [Oscillospiraceae bacterium]
MRNFDERKAEVFRRSENRIKERKRNRNRIFALCIPLCLIITVMSVTMLPSLFPVYDKNMSAEDEGKDSAGGIESSVILTMQVEQLGKDDALQSSVMNEDANAVTQIYYKLESAFVSSGENGKPAAGQESVEDFEDKHKENYSQSTTPTFSSGYKITFKTDKDTKAVFILNGNILTNAQTNEKVILSEDQRSQILNELGVVLTSWEVESE